MYRLLSETQLKQQIDAEQTYVAWRDASAKALNFVGGMHWKQVAGKEYLYRSLDRHGRAKSLGPRSAETENILSRFNQQKAESKQRLESLTASLATQSKINAALRLGSAPNIVADLCTRLAREGLLGSSLMIIGTNSMLAYEAMAGVRFDQAMLATSDIDFLWDHKARVKLVQMKEGEDEGAQLGLLGVLRKVDKSFQRMEGQSFRASNDRGYLVDLIRQMPTPPWKDEPDRFAPEGDLIATDLWNMKWLLSAPRLEQWVIARNGKIFPMIVPDPRAYAMFKWWLAHSNERDPIKKSRDRLQAKALTALVQDRLPHLAKNWLQITSFPKDISKQIIAELLADS
jgi:hypothetical protein